MIYAAEIYAADRDLTAMHQTFSGTYAILRPNLPPLSEFENGFPSRCVSHFVGGLGLMREA